VAGSQSVCVKMHSEARPTHGVCMMARMYVRCAGMIRRRTASQGCSGAPAGLCGPWGRGAWPREPRRPPPGPCPPASPRAGERPGLPPTLLARGSFAPRAVGPLPLPTMPDGPIRSAVDRWLDAMGEAGLLEATAVSRHLPAALCGVSLEFIQLASNAAAGEAGHARSSTQRLLSSLLNPALSRLAGHRHGRRVGAAVGGPSHPARAWAKNCTTPWHGSWRHIRNSLHGSW
jgi:hypothetical protein